MSADDLPRHAFADDSGYCARCGLSARTIANARGSIACERVEPAPLAELPMKRQRAEQERRARELGMDDL